MFTFLSRFRRQTAVLTALALVASVLVAVPVSAADPEPSLPATFDACVGDAAADAGFTDVPEGHANAGDIDCIAYYGVTRGTSASTYSPLMSVNREHMALFLIRLAGLVGIDVPPAGDSGFSDIGDLSDESQAAISQLAQLEITTGTSDTTYSPGDSVRRDHMALFISRLMNKMDPMEVDGTSYGSVPDDVDDLASDDVGSPFTDLDSVTKSAYDAITDLYELGVASGISDTAYGPSTLITRASMAEFMAAVLDHSNARPQGVSVQADGATGFGAIDPVLVVSHRGDMFVLTEDTSVTYFYTGNATSGDSDSNSVSLTDEGTCAAPADCTSDSDVTDEHGNFSIEKDVAEGREITYYVWVRDDDEEFDKDDVAYRSIDLSSSTDATHAAVESDINDNADPNTVDADVTDSVTLTVQLKDGETDSAGDVAKSEVKFTITWKRGEDDSADGVLDDAEIDRQETVTRETDDNGQIEFMMLAPDTDPDKDDADVLDTVTFTSSDVVDPASSMVVWKDNDPGTANKLKIDGPDYSLIYLDGTTSKVDGSATVTLYDMYGNPAGTGLRVTASIGGQPDGPERVNSRGQAKFSVTGLAVPGGNTLEVDVTAIAQRDGTEVTIGEGAGQVKDVEANPSIAVVGPAADNTPDDDVVVNKLLADEDKFIGDNSILFSYDSGDTFIDGSGKIIDLAKFEELLDARDGDQTADVDVVVYDEQGASIFRIEA